MSQMQLLPVLRRVFAADYPSALGDGQLLERFRAARDEAAFELLLRRHAAMVWGVCRRLVRDEHIAEDAFQATFLVLARKAGSIGQRDCVGGWLHRVALRIALQAREARSRRAVHEESRGEVPEIGRIGDDPVNREISRIVAEEVGCLPEKYRAPIVLCYLEGMAYGQAAVRLGWPAGTVSTRLTKARALLRIRLARRGLALPAAALTAELSAQIAVADTVIHTTLGAVLPGTAGSAANALAQGALHAMFITKLKCSVTAAMVIVLIASTGGLVGYRALAAGEEQAAPAFKKAVLPPEDELEQLRRENYRLRARLQLLEKEVEWLRQDIARLRGDKRPKTTELDLGPLEVEKPVRLQWRFEKGKPFFQEMKTETLQSMKVMGNDVKQTQNQTFVFSWTPIEHDSKGNWTFGFKIESLTIDLDIGGNKIAYDSSRTTSGPLLEFGKALVGAQFRVIIGPDLKILAIEGQKELLAKADDVNPQYKVLLQNVLSSEALEGTIRSLFRGTPPRAVAPGDSWTETTKQGAASLNSFTSRDRFTFEGKDQALERIKLEGTLNFEPPAKTDPKLPFTVKEANLTRNGTTGLLWFDRQRGRLDHFESTTKIEGELTIEIGGQSTKVDLRQSQRTTIRMTDGK
jgi:RNA polymerase sigma factor (sigma-70 family)